MPLSEDQIDALDRMLRPIIEAERAQAQRELIERMIADTEAKLTPDGVVGNARIDDELKAQAKWLRTYLPTEGSE